MTPAKEWGWKRLSILGLSAWMLVTGELAGSVTGATSLRAGEGMVPRGDGGQAQEHGTSTGEHRGQPSQVPLPPLRAQLAPGPIVRDHRHPPPGALPGEFAIRTKLKGTYLSAESSELAASSTIGPNEKFRLTVVSPQYNTIQTARGAYLSLTGSQDVWNRDSNPMRIVVTQEASLPTQEDPRLFAFSQDLSRQGSGVLALHTIAPKAFPTWLLEDASDRRDARYRFQFINLTSLATQQFWLLKCGDLGSGIAYAIMPKASRLSGAYLQGRHSVGLKAAVYVYDFDTFTLIRQSDGSYALQISDGVNYVSAVGGGGYASGTGTPDGANLSTNRTQVQRWERFRVVDRGNCTYTIQTANGWYIAVGPGGNISTRISDPDGAPSISYNAEFELIMWTPGR